MAWTCARQCRSTRNKGKRFTEQQTSNKKREKQKRPHCSPHETPQHQGAEQHAEARDGKACGRRTNRQMQQTRQPNNMPDLDHGAIKEQKLPNSLDTSRLKTHWGLYRAPQEKKKIKKNMRINEKKKRCGGGRGRSARVCLCERAVSSPNCPKGTKERKKERTPKGSRTQMQGQGNKGSRRRSGGGDKQRVMLLEANKSVAKLVCTLAMPAHRLLGVRVKVPAVPGARHL